MKFQSSTLLVLLATLAAAPGSDAFQNGNSPQAQVQTKTSSKTKDKTTLTISEAPMPFKWPVVGTLPDFINRGGVDGMSEVHESMYHDYGPVYKMSILGDDEMIFSDPRVFDQILRKEGKYPIGGAESVTSFSDYYKENDKEFALSAVGRGPEWKSWRQSINPDMYVLWNTYLPVIADTCSKISAIAGKEVTETKNLHISEFLSRAAFDMFAAVLYGESPETTNTEKATAEDIEFVKATKQAFDITGFLMTNPLEKIMGGAMYKEFVVNMDKTFGMASSRGMEKIRAAKELKLKTEAAVANGETADDEASSGCPVTAMKNTLKGGKDKFIPTDFMNPSYIERLVNREDLSEENIVEAQAPLLMAGVDTTAYVMGWFYLNMASNLDVQSKLADELHATLQGADVTTVEQMESLTYLKNCFRESHRLTPSAPMTIKSLEQDIDVVTDDKAYTLPAGMRASLNLRGLPMDPKYVESPREFRPERFSKEAVQARRGTPSALALDHPYMNDPFGRGKRRCLGANVAIAEMTVLAARLLQDWELKLVDPSEAVQSPTKSWQAKQKLMLAADPYPAMELVPRVR